MKKIHISLFSAFVLTVATVARADFIDTQERPSGTHTHHPVESFTDGGARYTYDLTSSGRIETFEELDATCGRVEHSSDVSYQTGRHIFMGDVKIIDISSTIVVQIFNAKHSGPLMFLLATTSNGGNLKKYGGPAIVATNCLNRWVAVKIDHDLDADTLKVYIDGELKWQGGASKDDFSGGVKYGTYGGDNRPVKVQWRNVQWWEVKPYKILNHKSGKVLNVNAASTTAGAQIIQWPYSADTTYNDEWYLIEVQAGFHQIQNRKSGMALNVQGASTTNGAPVIQWPYSGATPLNDDWQIVDLGNGYSKIVNRNSGKVLSVHGSSTADGAQIVQWSYTADSNQCDEWQILPAP